ncbi:MAG: MOSC domain-containing protein [Candidatus Omnitrophota bacterium]
MNIKKKNQGVIVALCISPQKHIAKHPVPSVFLKEDFGMEGDAHAGKTHRQVSLLSQESILKMKQDGVDVSSGCFGENIVVRHFALEKVKVGDRLKAGDTAVLEITQLGKECHNPCAIFKKVGYCIMPTQGVFARVVVSGKVKTQDPIDLA